MWNNAVLTLTGNVPVPSEHFWGLSHSPPKRTLGFLSSHLQYMHLCNFNSNGVQLWSKCSVVWFESRLWLPVRTKKNKTSWGDQRAAWGSQHGETKWRRGGTDHYNSRLLWCTLRNRGSSTQYNSCTDWDSPKHWKPNHSEIQCKQPVHN